MKIVWLATAFSLLTIVAPLTYGAEHYITGTVDISGGYSGPITPSLVSIRVGDVINFSYTFAGGQKIRLSDTPDGSSSWTRVTAWLGGYGGTPGSFAISNWKIDLIGATSGSGIARTSFSGEGLLFCCGGGFLGPAASFGLSDGDFLEFNGVRTTFTVDSLPADPSTYDRVSAEFNADNIENVPVMSHIFFPEIAVGGGWSTTFALCNTDIMPATGELYLMDQQGEGLIVNSPDMGEGTWFPISIPAGGTMFLTVNLPDPNDPAKHGWAMAEFQGSLSGVATYQFASEGVVSALAGVLSSQPIQFATIPIDDNVNEVLNTAYAIANPTDQFLIVKLCLVDREGNVVDDTVTVQLGQGEQIARYFFQDLNLLEFKGTAVLRAQGGGTFIAVALIQNQDLFTATPVEGNKAPHIPD